MNEETGPPPGGPPPEGAGSNGAARPACLCMGLGPELTQLLARLAGNDEMCQQAKHAWIELLKTIQALIDAHVASLTREPERKGTRLTVE